MIKIKSKSKASLVVHSYLHSDGCSWERLDARILVSVIVRITPNRRAIETAVEIWWWLICCRLRCLVVCGNCCGHHGHSQANKKKGNLKYMHTCNSCEFYRITFQLICHLKLHLPVFTTVYTAFKI